MTTHLEMEALIFSRQGVKCLMPDCDEDWSDKAHVDGSGMGGRPSTFTIDNMVGLCRPDHRIFDGQDLQGRQYMLRTLMRTLAATVAERRVRELGGDDVVVTPI